MNNRNIIFLDVDGVLNCDIFHDSEQFKTFKVNFDPQSTDRFLWLEGQICRERIKWLNQLCEETGTDVVISASMRKSYTNDELRKIFNYFGATFNIIGKTPNMNTARGIEIGSWLRTNITIDVHGCEYYDFVRYAIIDDDSDMLLNQRNHFFQTDGYSGLTPNTCYKIKRFFNQYKTDDCTKIL